MSEEVPTFPRVAMTPSTWVVECTCCGAEVEVPEVEQDDSGAWHGKDEHCIVHCEACDQAMEPFGAIVTATEEPFWTNGRGI